MIKNKLHAAGILFAGFVSLIAAQAPVLFFTCVYNNPKFIELQHKTFKAFMQVPYRYVVFDDGKDGHMSQTNAATCSKHGIEYVRMPQRLHQSYLPNIRHTDTIHYALSTLCSNYDGLVVLLDADMFLINPFNPYDYMGNYAFIGGEQTRGEGEKKVVYIAPTLVFFDMTKLPNKETLNFSPGEILGNHCDVGGYMYYYLKNNPSLNYRLFVAKSTHWFPQNVAAIRQLGINSYLASFIIGEKYGFELHGDHNFMHYYAGGSNWPQYSAEYLQQKDRIFYGFMQGLFEYYGYEW